MNILLQGVAAVIVGRGYLSSDHFSTATALNPAITISKNGGNFANPAAGASEMTEIESTGWYKFSLGTGDTDTLGALIIRGTHATMDNIEVVYQVVAAVTAANLTQVNGAAQTATLDTIKAETVLIVADTGELQTNQGNWLTATGFGTSAELAKVPKSDSNVTWNATALASINAEVDTALNTAIPGSPVADSINERIVAIDTAGTPPTASAIADAVWDEVVTTGAHDTATFAGKQLLTIKTQTDKLAFTVANKVDANIKSVNDVTVDGAGTTGDPWGPV